MTEREWLTSDDPAAMLAWLTDRSAGSVFARAKQRATYRPSDRKLRLFIDARACPECLRLTADMSTVEAAEYVAGANCGTVQQSAALLREVFGNPWRPVRLAVCPCGGDYCTNPTCNYPDPDGVTPAVRALAESIDAARVWDRLPELADALEAAGCREAELLMHLRGKKRCVQCGEDGCSYCEGGWVDDWWLRTPSPAPPLHVRGCWALDLIRGKE